MSTIQSSNGNQYVTPGIGLSAAGYFVGSAAQGATNTILNTLSARKSINKIRNLNQGVNVEEIRNGLNKALNISGMTQKGVKIVDYTNSTRTSKTDFKLFKEFIEHIKQGKYYNIIDEKLKNMVAVGDNAFYSFKHNNIHINAQKAGTLGFHEIGHAINRQSSKFWKSMQNLRGPMTYLTLILPTIALLKRKKVEGEEPNGLIDKTTTFIKENVGKLTTLTFIPILAEEFKATARGNKLAKQVLSPELASKVIKSNKWGAISYIGAAVGAGIAVSVANKIKDAIAKPKLVKNPEI